MAEEGWNDQTSEKVWWAINSAGTNINSNLDQVSSNADINETVT